MNEDTALDQSVDRKYRVIPKMYTRHVWDHVKAIRDENVCCMYDVTMNVVRLQSERIAHALSKNSCRQCVVLKSLRCVKRRDCKEMLSISILFNKDFTRSFAQSTDPTQINIFPWL